MPSPLNGSWKITGRSLAQLLIQKFGPLDSSEPTTLLSWVKVKEALNTVKGGFAYLLMLEDKLIAALDPNGFRPLSIGKMANGAIVVSSETCAFEVVGAEGSAM